MTIAANQEPIYYQKIKVTREFFEDMPRFAIDELRYHAAKTGFDIAEHYFTFEDDDWEKLMITARGFSQVYVRKMLVRAPEDKIEEAIEWVVNNNPHLRLEFTGEKGWVNDDMVCNAITAILNIKRSQDDSSK
jgi:hypothetical protein